jgi:hypothetical protein
LKNSRPAFLTISRTDATRSANINLISFATTFSGQLK